jgi:hypothetical protein
VLRHPLRRAISTYYFHKHVSKKWKTYPDTMPISFLKRLVDEDNVALSISGMKTSLSVCWTGLCTHASTAWSFGCMWSRCKFRFCGDLTPQDGARLDEATLVPSLELFHNVMDGHIGCVWGLSSSQT